MSREKVIKIDSLGSDANTTMEEGQTTNHNANELSAAVADVCDCVKDKTGEKEVISVSIKQCLNPILHCLSVSGCYEFYVGKKNKLQTMFVYIYRVFVFLVIAATILKFISAFFYLQKHDMMMNGLYLTWLCLCASYFAVHVKSTSIRFGFQEETFKAFDDIAENLSKTGCQCPVATIKRRVFLGTMIGCVLVLTNMVGIGLQITFHPSSKTFYSSPFQPTWISLVLFLMAEFMFSLIWIFPVIYIIIICDIMKHVFNAYNSFLEEIVGRKDSKALNDIQQLRIQHLRLCKLVNNLDADAGWFFASTCLLNLGLSCFSLYELIKVSLDGFSLFLFIFWLTASLAALGLITIFAAVVNDKVRTQLTLILLHHKHEILK